MNMEYIVMCWALTFSKDHDLIKGSIQKMKIFNLWSTNTKNALNIKNPHVVKMGIFHLNGILGMKIDLFK